MCRLWSPPRHSACISYDYRLSQSVHYMSACCKYGHSHLIHYVFAGCKHGHNQLIQCVFAGGNVGKVKSSIVYLQVVIMDTATSSIVYLQVVIVDIHLIHWVFTYSNHGHSHLICCVLRFCLLPLLTQSSHLLRICMLQLLTVLNHYVFAGCNYWLSSTITYLQVVIMDCPQPLRICRL